MLLTYDDLEIYSRKISICSMISLSIHRVIRCFLMVLSPHNSSYTKYIKAEYINEFLIYLKLSDLIKKRINDYIWWLYGESNEFR